MKKLFYMTLALAFALGFQSCSGWKEMESIKIKVDTYEDQNPEAYAAYCEALKEYKASDHKLMYVVWENTDAAYNQSQQLTSLPDSVDIVEFITPDIQDRLVPQMAELKEKKGFRFAIRLSYDDVLADYEAAKAEIDANLGEGEEAAYPDFYKFEDERIAAVLEKAEKYGYDCLTVTYNGSDTAQMYTAEKEEYFANQRAWFDGILAWADSHKDVDLFIQTSPQYIMDEITAIDSSRVFTKEQVLARTECFVFNTRNSSNLADLDYYSLAAISADESAASCKFLYAVETVLDDKKTGIFQSGDQIPLAAEWMTVPDDFNKGGLVVWNAQRAFFDINLVYSVIRNATAVMNPNS